MGMRKRTLIALRKTAANEAGHAVEAFMLDVPFRSVTIKKDAETLGQVRFREWPRWANPHLVE